MRATKDRYLRLARLLVVVLIFVSISARAEDLFESFDPKKLIKELRAQPAAAVGSFTEGPCTIDAAVCFYSSDGKLHHWVVNRGYRVMDSKGWKMTEDFFTGYDEIWQRQDAYNRWATRTRAGRVEGEKIPSWLPACGFLTLDTLKIPAFKATKQLSKLEFYFRSDCHRIDGIWERAECVPFIHHQGMLADGVRLPAPPDDPLPDEFFAERAKSIQAVYDTIVALEKAVDALRPLTHGGNSSAYQCGESQSLDVDRLPPANARRLSELEQQLERNLDDAKSMDQAYLQVHGRQEIPELFPE